MILTKLQETLAEVATQRAALDAQRAALDEVEAQLRIMVGKLAGATPIAHAVASQLTSPAPLAETRDRIDTFVDILRAEGRPLHITALAEKLTERTGETIDRTKIEPGLNRHVANAKRLRIAKFGPSTFGLPEWKHESAQNQLTNVA